MAAIAHHPLAVDQHITHLPVTTGEQPAVENAVFAGRGQVRVITVQHNPIRAFPHFQSTNRLAQRLGTAVQRGIKQRAADRKLGFQVEVQPGAPAMLFTDRQRLEQILKNLLSNAVKFTEQGAVSLSVSRAPGECIAFTVRDSGIGIALDQQESIFEAFRQADGTTNRRYGGTGLGLSISRDLATLLGGYISVTSEPGKGSLFTLVLPEQYVERGEDAAPVEQPSQMVVAPAPTPVKVSPLPVADANLIPRFAEDRASAASPLALADIPLAPALAPSGTLAHPDWRNAPAKLRLLDANEAI